MLYYAFNTITRYIAGYTVFGMQRGTEYVKSLVDFLTLEEFDYQTTFLKVRWDEQEHSIYPAQESCFYQWFVKS